MNERILVIEDEPAISELVAVNLRHSGYQISQASDANEAMAAIEQHKPDLLVLDWMLPDVSGIDLAKRLRANDAYRHMPIIMLTARAQEGDKLQGFDVGVDDYLTKPFSPRELIARVGALLRRSSGDQSSSTDDEPLQADSLRLEPLTHRVYAGTELLELSPTEFKLLHYFMANPERVLSRGKLLDAVWGSEVVIEERTVDVHIRRLRLVLRPHLADTVIQTVRGGGYRFSAS